MMPRAEHLIGDDSQQPGYQTRATILTGHHDNHASTARGTLQSVIIGGKVHDNTSNYKPSPVPKLTAALDPYSAG